MSLKPYRKSRRHHHRPRLESGQWNFRPPSIHPLEWFGKKSFVLLLVTLTISGILGGAYAIPNNPLFHNIHCLSTGNLPCNDPATLIWQATAPNNDLSEFNTVGNLAQFFQNGNCAANGWTGSCMRLTSSQTVSTVAVTKNSVGDLGIANGKTLGFHITWGNIINVISGITIVQGIEWGYYLTTNSTIPSATNYNPRTDPSVIFNSRTYCSANCSNSPGTFVSVEYLMRNIGKGETIAGEGTDVCGNSSNPIFLCQTSTMQIPTSLVAGNPVADSSVYLNYTAKTNQSACGITNATGTFGAGCSYLENGDQPIPNAQFWSFSDTFPWSSFQSQQLYLGFYVRANGSPGTTMAVNFFFNTNNGSVINGTPVGTGCGGGGCFSNMVIFYWVPTPSGTIVGPQIDTGGFFGPIIKALINIGVWILNGVLAFIGFITPALQAALNFLVSILVSGLNGLGNALGLGNVGTDLQSLINAVIVFFASGNFAAIFTNLPASVSRLLDILSIYFPWLPNALAIALNIATFAVNGINFLITIFTFATNIGIGILATVLIVLFFVYTGDNALGGFLEFAQTALWLIVGLGLKFLINLANFALDIVTSIIGIIPKPLIQMSTHALPRIPVVDVEASFIPPSGLMGEIRNGNLFAMALWISGLLFTALFENASPALPGSIGAILPSAAPALTSLVGLIPLLEIMTTFVWIAAVFIVPIGWFANALDLGELPFESGLGGRPITHFGVRISKAEKHTGDIRGAVRGVRSVFSRRAKPLKSEGPTPEQQATA